ncbi:hypothetical protein COBT_001497, partial [Conglomerata obtusa]
MTQVIAVMSGKGGVGKSTISSLIALIASETGKTILLDFDICGPSINHIFNTNKKVHKAVKGLSPVQITENLYILSMSSLIKQTDSVIWRGPKKLQVLNMFYESISEFQYVIIDLPPGLSEEHQFLVDKNINIVIVTTPQNLSLNDTSIAINFCLEKKLRIIGLIENMSGFKCENCNCNVNIFAKKGGVLLAEEYGIDFLCAIELNSTIGDIIEDGSFCLRYKEIPEYN